MSTTPRVQSALAMSLFIPTELERQQLYHRVVDRPTEIVGPSDCKALEDYYALLQKNFKPEELEPLERLQKEIAGNTHPNAKARYFCILLRDPGADNQIVSGAYASMKDGVVALRFALTGKAYRETGISQELIRQLVKEASRWSVGQGHAFWACFGECVERSEVFFNRVLGMRRLYTRQSETSLQEIHYELPYLGGWTTEGNPLVLASPTREHLQLVAADHSEKLSYAVVEKILQSVWQEWYVRSEDGFTPSGWRNHTTQVLEETLRDRILAPLRPHPELILLSRAERESWRQAGWHITDLEL